MKRIICILFLVVGFSNAMAQIAPYSLVGAKKVSSEVVQLQINVFCNNKRQIFSEAQCAAIRIALFDGVGIPPYTKPLLSDGEQTMNQTYPDYFNNLFYSRYSDFIGSCTAISKFKKSDNKSTLFVVDLKILLLRKDLEKNNIKRQIGY